MAPIVKAFLNYGVLGRRRFCSCKFGGFTLSSEVNLGDLTCKINMHVSN